MAHRMDIVTLEMAGALEHWSAFVDGTVHVLLRVPVKCRCCGKEHAWFVNREGRTTCTECDAAEQTKRSAAARLCAGVAS